MLIQAKTIKGFSSVYLDILRLGAALVVLFHHTLLGLLIDAQRVLWIRLFIHVSAECNSRHTTLLYKALRISINR